MPNWCQNVATFKHTDSDMMAKLNEAIDSKDLFKSFFPTPFELDDGNAHCWGGSEQQIADQNAIRSSNNEKYGYENGHEWRCGEWGTKWDASDLVVTDESANQITVIFDTAWTPPIGFYDKMADLGFDIDAKYYESGCGFCGRYDESGDTCYEWEDLESARKTIPTDIDEEFNIIETLEEWDEGE